MVKFVGTVVFSRVGPRYSSCGGRSAFGGLYRFLCCELVRRAVSGRRSLAVIIIASPLQRPVSHGRELLVSGRWRGLPSFQGLRYDLGWEVVRAGKSFSE